MRGDSYSFAEARQLAGHLATSLVGLGAQPGDVLAVLLPNMPEYVIVMLGASEASLKVTTLNPVYTQREIRQKKRLRGTNSLSQERSAASCSTARPSSS